MKETKQFYSHYLNWEDWQNGMYEMQNKDREFSEAWEVENDEDLIAD